MNIGSQIKAIRKAKNVSQKDLAKKIGISNTYLSDIENSRCFPSIKTLYRISKGLGEEIALFFPPEATL